MKEPIQSFIHSSRRRALLGAACAVPVVSVLAPVGRAAAQSADAWPVKPIRLLMPNAPGSSLDTLGRIIGQRLGEALGQQLIIDNRAGAGGLIGMEIGKNANPDGYTIIFASPPSLTVAPFLQAKPPFDPLNDFVFISTIGVTPNLLVVNPTVPVKTLAEFLDTVRNKKTPMNMASAGAGSQSHLAGVMLTNLGKFESLHVPYKGGGPSVAAVVAGEAQWTITPAPAVVSLVKGGKLRLLAHSLPKRTPLLADLPAVIEQVPGYDYSGWVGLLAPRGTARTIQERLRAALEKTMTTPEMREAMASQATEIQLSTPDAFRALVQRSLVENRTMIKALNLSE
ncbi:MAG: tripartite tricarboxylate transporter substrate binding protein [Proteobacteria bacterium]|nr:tripartite tricarboxylate transporter substrate binding protein [Burkholderiales bacterium]